MATHRLRRRGTEGRQVVAGGTLTHPHLLRTLQSQCHFSTSQMRKLRHEEARSSCPPAMELGWVSFSLEAGEGGDVLSFISLCGQEDLWRKMWNAGGKGKYSKTPRKSDVGLRNQVMVLLPPPRSTCLSY